MANLKDALTGTDARGVAGDVQCYATNVAELASKIETGFTDGGKFVKLDLKTAVQLLQIVWDAFKKSARDCAGKDIVVKPPTGVLGSLVAFVMSWLGFRL